MVREFTNEDCMDLMKRYPDNHFDLAIVDPPYGIDINSSGRVGHYGGKKKWDCKIPDESYFTLLFCKAKNIIIWGGNYFSLPRTRCFLIWDKKQPQNISFASCEYAWTNFDSSAKTFYMSPINADKDGRIHPTQKPVALYNWILKNYAKHGDLILDTHVGSASSLIACEELGFQYVGCELDKDYYESAKNRIEKYREQLKLF